VIETPVDGDPFNYIGPRPEGPFPPGKEDYAARNRIEWFELLGIVAVVTGRRPTFDDEVRYAIPSVVNAARKLTP
jgi:hypothetical protein